MENNEEKNTYTVKLLVVTERPVFPGGITTLVVSRAEEIKLIENLGKGGIFGILMAKERDSFDNCIMDSTLPPEFYDVGTLCSINRFIHLPNGSLHVFVTTMRTFTVHSVDTLLSPYEAVVEDRNTEYESMRPIVPYMRLLRKILSELVTQSPLFSFASEVNIANITDAENLVNYTASCLSAPKEFLQEVLAQQNLISRYEKVLTYLESEKDLVIMQNQIRSDLIDNVKRRNQEQVLKQQISTLQQELDKITGKGGSAGAFSPRGMDMADLADKYDKIKNLLPPIYIETVDKEMSRMNSMDPSSPDYTLTKTYIDTILSLPYSKKNQKVKYTIENVREKLDKDHYGLKDVKDRILEFLASRTLSRSQSGAIICLVGPPGVGKTSIGRSIASALGRKYYRFSMGGVRDEAEIKGHRRTYVGALPGKFIQALLETKEVDPVILIDEIDKMGASFQGDPASALLEALDPEQNRRFRDLYLDLPYDLSKVLFIVTANTLETVPEPLLDRMEVIEVSGYTSQEKLNIAKGYLIPRLIKNNGLEKRNISLSDDALLSIAEEYSREAGVRNYEKNLDKIFRKLSLEILEKKSDGNLLIEKKDVEKYLSIPRFDLSEKIEAEEAGTAIGLAWTSMGGDVLLIEAEALLSHEEFKITGQLGDVMKESCNIALSTVKKEAALRGMDPAYFRHHMIHLHVPEGATPKDGPSAGITMTCALWGMLTEQVIKKDLAMTGELTLTGHVMPIGGLKEKVLAAKRNHIKEIIIPEKNKRDLEMLDEDVKKDITFHLVSDISEVLHLAFPSDKTRRLTESELEKAQENWEKENQKNG